MKKILAILTLLFTIWDSAIAQSQYLFNNSNGLTNSRINDIATDKNGMIWVATMDGLSVFDGRNFTKNAFAHQNINKICPLPNNDVLAATDKGVWRFDYRLSHFSPIKFGVKGNMTPFVSDIIHNDTIAYIATSGFGLYTYRLGDTAINFSPMTKLLDTKYIHTIFLDSKDRLWVGAFDQGTYIFRNGLLLSTPPDIPSDICKYIEDEKGNIYAASATSGVAIIPTDNKTRRISLGAIGKNFPVTSMMLEGNKLLVGTDGLGLWEYDTNTEAASQISYSDLPFDFSKSKIHDIMKDDDGNLWLGIYHKGLMLVTKESPIFENYYYRPNSDKNIGSNSVGAIASSNGEVWIGTEGDGIYVINSDKTTSHIDLTDQDGRPMTANIISMHNQDDKFIWIGTYSNDFIKFDIKARRIAKMYDIPCEKVSCICQRSDGKLLITSLGGGIGSFDPKTEEYTPGILVNPQWANCITVDNSGDHWIGTYDGLWYVASDTKTSRKYTVENGFLTDNTINDIFIDEKNQVWCATKDGIMVINPMNDKKRQLLAGHTICSITNDKMGYVWASGYDGLVRIDMEHDTFIQFGMEDGLKGSEFVSRAGITMDNGMACFGSTMGITMIKNDKLTESPTVGDVVLTGVTINNTDVEIGTQYDDIQILDKNIAEADTIQLSESTNYFAIKFATSNPANIERTSFKYRLLGFDSTFTQCSRGIMQASFTKIKSGTYTFEVIAGIRDTYSPTRRLTIIIHPTWYKTTTAKTLFAIVAVLVALLVFEYFNEKMRRRQSEQINDMKMQFFINLSHEVRTPLTLIIDPLEKLLSKPGTDAETMRLYNIMKINSQRILRLVSQLLDLRKMDKSQVMMKFGKTELCSFVRAILESCSPAADTKEITVNFTNNHNSEIYAWIDPENFEKVMLNLINNATKFVPVGGEIDIDISQYDDENKIRITVKDNGIGIKKEELEKIFERFYQVKSPDNRYITGTGVGLHLARYLVELHKGRLYAENRKDTQGSIFTVELQMGKDHLTAQDIIEQQDIPPHLNALVKRASDPAQKTIYVIDDEESIRNYLTEQLCAEYNVMPFENGKKAFDSLSSTIPTLIICDIMMPEMDGWTFCRKVKKNFKTSHIPVILLTALGDDNSKAQGIDIGADMYLEKPFNTEMLKKITKNMIENREKVAENIVQKADAYTIENIELKSQDEILIQKVKDIIKEKISCRDLNVETLADTIGISRVHLHRKIKDITGLSVRDYLKNIRMKQASLLLTNKNLTISEIAYAVGYSNPAHFSSSFKAFYGVSPTEYSGRSSKDSPSEEPTQKTDLKDNDNELTTTDI